MRTYIVDDIRTIVESIRAKNAIAYGNGENDVILYGGSLSDQIEYNEETLPPYYMHGHRLEIANKLLEHDKDMVRKFQKYPLIALRQDISEGVKDYNEYKLNIIIVTYTDPKLKAEQRYESDRPFKSVLYPLYEEFMDALVNSGLFTWPGNQDYPPHTKIDRPYWGTPASEKNEKSIFFDPLDAIEIIDLQINRMKTC